MNIHETIARFLDDALDRGRKFRPDVEEIALHLLEKYQDEHGRSRRRMTLLGKWPSRTKRDVLESAIYGLMVPDRTHELRAYFGQNRQQQEHVALSPVSSAPTSLN